MKGNTRRLTGMAVLCALSIVLVALVHFPLFPAAPFLEYDPADIPILIGTFMYGPIPGFVLAVVTSVIQGFTVSAQSGIIGIIMHIFAIGSFALVAGYIYERNKSVKSAVIALIVGSLVSTVMMVIWNLIFTPIFMGTSFDAVLAMIVPIIIPFNLLKAGINSVITFIVYKPISRILGLPQKAKQKA